MDYGSSAITAEDLVRWLDQSLFKPLHGLTQSQRRAYLAAVVQQPAPPPAVCRWWCWRRRGFSWRAPSNAHVADLRDAATRQQLPAAGAGPGRASAWLVEPDWAHPHVLKPGRYPAPVASRYSGRYQFGKHYFPVLADLKDGGQEFQCAQLHRPPSRVTPLGAQPGHGPLWLWPAHLARAFYPDFVAELVDGRVALLEFKGRAFAERPLRNRKTPGG